MKGVSKRKIMSENRENLLWQNNLCLERINLQIRCCGGTSDRNH